VPVPGKREFFYPLFFFIILTLILAGLTWANGRFLGQVTQPDSFEQYWKASNLWLHQGLNPYSGSIPFNLTFISMIFLTPFGLLDYAIARVLWLTSIEVSLVMITLIAILFSGWKVKTWALPAVLLISLTWYYAVRAIFFGQFSVLILLVMMISFLLIIRKQDGIAGFVLALAVALPSYSFLIIVYVVIWSFAARRFQVFYSLLAGLFFIFTISIILLPGWPVQWLGNAVGDINGFNWRTSILSLMTNSVPGIQYPLSIALNGSILILLIMEWLQSLKNAESKFAWAVLFTITANCLIRLNSDACDVLGLMPVLFFILKVVQDRWVKAADISAVILGVCLLTVPWFIVLLDSSHAELEPSAVIVILPGLCIVGLLWIKWWVRRPSQLPFEILRDRIG
jgi:hypothetical protein